MLPVSQTHLQNGHSQHNTLHPIFPLPDRAVGHPSVCCSGCPGQLLGPWKLQQQVQSSLRTLQAFPGSSAQSGGHRPAVGPESCPAATAATEYASMLWPSHFMAMFLAPWAERRSHHRSLPPLGAINWWSHSLKESLVVWEARLPVQKHLSLAAPPWVGTACLRDTSCGTQGQKHAGHNTHTSPQTTRLREDAHTSNM
jgi:hypothetical protein